MSYLTKPQPTGGRARYEEVECRTAINPVKGMDFRWSLNPYRGCVHGCHYCFAGRFHAYYDLGPGADFTGIIFAKTNVADVLAEEMSRRSWRRELVVMGTATDPYQPIEGKYRLTRQCLEAFARWRSPVSLVTKGTMIVRDVDVLEELAKTTESAVCFSVSTMDSDLARRLEPGTPPPSKRIDALERLARAGVKTGVSLAPIIPGITDSTENLRAVATAAASNGARFLWGSVLYLKPGTKEHFLSFLSEEYPALESRFQDLYPGAYAPRSTQSRVRGEVADIKRSLAIGSSPAYERTAAQPRQLRLAIG